MPVVVRRDPHAELDLGWWTMFVPLRLLEQCIVFEEEWQAYRLEHFERHNVDPGRPDYYFGENVSRN